MSVYEDMANDAGYPYGTDENRQMAEMAEQYERDEYHKWMEEQYYYHLIGMREFFNEYITTA